jgi:hypothetical protein
METKKWRTAKPFSMRGTVDLLYAGVIFLAFFSFDVLLDLTMQI